jgi:hypothetical protein
MYFAQFKTKDRGAQPKLEPDHFPILELHQNDLVQNIYFTKYKPKDRGRSWSHIILPFWSCIKMMWF